MPNHYPKQQIWGSYLLFIAGKFKFSAQGSDLAPFVGYGIKAKIQYEIKPHFICKKRDWIQHSTIPLKSQVAMPCAIGVFLHTYKERFLSVY